MFRVEQFYLLCQGLSVSSKASRCLLLLSLGIYSVEYIIKQKRNLYLLNLLTKSESSLVVKVFNPMRNSNVKSDWINTTLTDLRDLGIDKNLDQISTMCKNQFKVLVKSSLRNACFQSLLREKHKLKKGAEMCFEKFEILPYLHSTSCLNVSSMRKIYHVQTREIVLKYNYPTQFNDTFCGLHFICWWGLGGFW